MATQLVRLAIHNYLAIFYCSLAYLLFGRGVSWTGRVSELADVKRVPQNKMNTSDIVK